MKKYLEKLKNRYWNYRTLKFLVKLAFFIIFGVLVVVNMNLVVEIPLYIVLYIGLMICNGIFNEVEKEEAKIPILNKRFTEKLEDGSVGIKKENAEEAILYLYEIEEKLNK